MQTVWMMRWHFWSAVLTAIRLRCLLRAALLPAVFVTKRRQGTLASTLELPRPWHISRSAAGRIVSSACSMARVAMRSNSIQKRKSWWSAGPATTHASFKMVNHEGHEGSPRKTKLDFLLLRLYDA